ncbi:hypothetical protein E1B28_013661 [Marasmius oreades]|uniref:Pali-domain-containing protein n=1 Tax=Marasmius oreades TaxID=181124 RepID=A0A9P7RQ85_9AGAR|nr:uncharacterized protein E1B28_013661 [Marasmius oreades]KAG7087714.1 hypothetical protein E1B28_013661 [Marasmius oreades]
MARAFCIPGIIFLLCATVLSFLVSISLPFLPALDIARTHFPGTALVNGQIVDELRFGVWAQCTYTSSDDRICAQAQHAYSVSISNTRKDSGVIIGSSWTRGLAIHPVATAVTFIAFLLSFSTHVTITLISSVVSFLAALITLIAFAVDIALYAFLKHEAGNVNDVRANTKTAPGFWLTFVSLILLLLAGCTVCFGRRRDRMAGASSPAYPMSSTKKRPFWQRFRRN